MRSTLPYPNMQFRALTLRRRRDNTPPPPTNFEDLITLEGDTLVTSEGDILQARTA